MESIVVMEYLSSIDPAAIWLVVQVAGLGVGLALFGVAYNDAYAKADAEDRNEGYQWAWLVGGCLANLVALGILFGPWVLLAGLWFFGCSGAFMAKGEWDRYTDRRRRTIEHARRKAGKRG